MRVCDVFNHVRLCVCPYVQTITFKSLHIETSFLIYRYIFTISRSILSIKVIESRSYEKSDNFIYYRPQTKLWEGYVFTGVCDSVHRGVCPIACWDTTPWQGRPPPCAVHAGRYGQQAGDMHPTGMQSCSVFDFSLKHIFKLKFGHILLL